MTTTTNTDADLRQAAALQADLASNARLIAAAPEMLAALQAIAAECEIQGETEYTYAIGRTARNAIAEATQP